MTRPLLAFLLLSISFLQAEPPTRLLQPQPLLEKAGIKTPLQENHRIILTVTARDGSPLELCFTTGAPFFTASLEEQGISFSGTLESVSGDTAILGYTLTWETPVTLERPVTLETPVTLERPAIGSVTNVIYKKSSLQGSVRLELGKGLVLFRAGKQSAHVSVLRLEPGTP